MVEVQVKRRKMYKRKILDFLRLGVSYIILIIMAIAAIFPIYYIIITSFSNTPGLQTLSLSVLLPKHLYITAYKELFTLSLGGGANFLRWLGNTLILAFSTLIVTVLIALITGYAMSRLDIPAKNIISTFLYLITFFPFTAMMVPLYILFAKLNLINYLGLILAYSGGNAIFTSFIIRLGIDAIPTAYEEIAMIDGLSRFQIVWRIMARLVRPFIIFAAIMAFQGAYLDFALAYAFLFPNEQLWTGLIGIYYMAGLVNPASAPSYNIFAAGVVILGIPIMAIFLAAYKIITRAYSVMGGVKQ